jgi:hypothetical protein
MMITDPRKIPEIAAMAEAHPDEAIGIILVNALQQAINATAPLVCASREDVVHALTGLLAGTTLRAGADPVEVIRGFLWSYEAIKAAGGFEPNDRPQA